MSLHERIRFVLIAPFLLLVTSCAGSDAATYTGVVIDTLANGAIHVQNAAEGQWALTGSAPLAARGGTADRAEGRRTDLFGAIRNLILNRDGSVWVLESQTRELRLFDAEGRFMGRPGEEFGRMSIMHITPDHLDGVVRDEFDVPYVVRWGIRRA